MPILSSLRHLLCDIITQMHFGLHSDLAVGNSGDPDHFRAGINSNVDRLDIAGGLEAESNGEGLTADDTSLTRAQPIPDFVAPSG